MNDKRERDARSRCTCGVCKDGYNAPEEWCPPVYRSYFSLLFRQGHVLAKIDKAARTSSRHGDVWAKCAELLRADMREQKD